MKIYLKLLLVVSFALFSGCNCTLKVGPNHDEISELGYSMVNLFKDKDTEQRIKEALEDGKITEEEYHEIEMLAHPDRRSSKDKLMDEFKTAEKE